MGEVTSFRFKDNRKLREMDNPYQPIPSNYWVDWGAETKEAVKALKGLEEALVAPVPTVKPKPWTGKWDGRPEPAKVPDLNYGLPWLGEYMETQHLTYNIGEYEMVGLITVPLDRQPASDTEALTWLMSKFLALVQRARKEGMPLTRLPEVVFGQVGNGYQAQVTLTLKVDSPYA